MVFKIILDNKTLTFNTIDFQYFRAVLKRKSTEIEALITHCRVTAIEKPLILLSVYGHYQAYGWTCIAPVCNVSVVAINRTSEVPCIVHSFHLIIISNIIC